MNSAFRRRNGSTPFRLPRHPDFPVIPVSPSFRRKPESTRHDGLRFSPAQRIRTIPIFPSYRGFRHSGESRNLCAAIDSAFRRSDGSTPFRFPRHSDSSRHSGASRNLRATMDSALRRSNGGPAEPPKNETLPLRRPPFQSDRLTPRRPNAGRNPGTPPALPLAPARPPPGQAPTREETPQ